MPDASRRFVSSSGVDGIAVQLDVCPEKDGTISNPKYEESVRRRPLRYFLWAFRFWLPSGATCHTWHEAWERTA